MNDRELLELAAKAAGEITPSWYGNKAYLDGLLTKWNPLINDGDALRLAVKLEMNIFSGYKKMIAEIPSDGDMPSIQESEIKGENPQAATRRAIVRAAAEIGRGKDD